MPTIGFLHTAGAHVLTFRVLVGELSPGTGDVHVVDDGLLADARRHGVDDALRRRIGVRIDELASQGADVVVCTCSTIGGEAEAFGSAALPVVRIDRPMARAAVEAAAASGAGSGRAGTGGAGRIAVVVAVASTLGPTRAVLADEARSAGRDVVLVNAPCLDAWGSFERGDVPGYLDQIAAHVDRLISSGSAEVVVLAQASMAPVAERFADADVPVLCSPRAAVSFAAGLLAR